MNNGNSINISNSTHTGDILQGSIVEGGIKNTYSNIKNKILNTQDVITYFESANGLDFINPNYQKSSDNYGKIFKIVHDKLKLINMQGCLIELQQEQTDANKLFFLKILKPQILADEKFAHQLMDIIQ